MFATDFLFDGNRANDFGLMIGSFDSEISTATGGDIEYTVVKSPNSDRFEFYGSQLNTVITWEFSIIKNPCLNNDNCYFSQYEESQIAQWLLKQDGYRWFQFDQKGYEDIYYRVQINMIPHQIGGMTVGFDLTVVSDCGYGYSEEILKEYTLNKDKPIRLDIHSDINSYILPYISLTGSGKFYISNDSDLLQNKSNGKATELQLQNTTQAITMNSDTNIITGISSANNFNWYFLRLVNGVNNITTNSNNIQIKIIYREPRRIIV